MEKKLYSVTRPDIEWVAGKRVQDGKIALTEREAGHDLARGNIELVKAPAGAKVLPSTKTDGKAGED